MKMNMTILEPVLNWSAYDMARKHPQYHSGTVSPLVAIKRLGKWKGVRQRLNGQTATDDSGQSDFPSVQQFPQGRYGR